MQFLEFVEDPLGDGVIIGDQGQAVAQTIEDARNDADQALSFADH